MIAFSLLSDAAANVDPGAVGVSITSLIGSFGAAGAAVAVTYYFLGFLKDQAGKQDQMFQEFREYHAESQRKFQDQLDRLSERQVQSQQAFQEQIARITEAQNLLLRDAIVATKSVEKTVDSSTEAIRGIEKTIASLQTSIATIDAVIRHSGNLGSPANATDRSTLSRSG
jgi:hypothetical protein